MKKERPILFSTEMVEAILDGRKTMTRRKLKEQLPIGTYRYWIVDNELCYRIVDSNIVRTHCKCPYGKVGDILWVRETFEEGCMGGYIYKAGRTAEEQRQYKVAGYNWKSSRFMPKAAARIWLEINDIKVERLKEISEEDAVKEGVEEMEEGWFKCYNKKLAANGWECGYATTAFQSLWCAINGIESWETNPWVWVISFNVLSTTGRPWDKLGPF